MALQDVASVQRPPWGNSSHVSPLLPLCTHTPLLLLLQEALAAGHPSTSVSTQLTALLCRTSSVGPVQGGCPCPGPILSTHILTAPQTLPLWCFSHLHTSKNNKEMYILYLPRGLVTPHPWHLNPMPAPQYVLLCGTKRITAFSLDEGSEGFTF